MQRDHRNRDLESEQRQICRRELRHTFAPQRALLARGLYKGPVTGTLTPRTRAAIQGLQRQNGGPDSSVLSLATARSLGLIAVERE